MILKALGKTPDGRCVVGGAFQLADTQGIPLSVSMDTAESKNLVVSIPHYFASALEHGWDDKQVFGKITEAFMDRGQLADMPRIEHLCIAMFMEVAKAMPGAGSPEMARAMREQLEAV